MSDEKEEPCCEDYVAGGDIINGALAFCQNHHFNYNGMPYFRFCPYCGKFLNTKENLSNLKNTPDKELIINTWLPIEVFNDWTIIRTGNYLVGVFKKSKIFVEIADNIFDIKGWTHIMKVTKEG